MELKSFSTDANGCLIFMDGITDKEWATKIHMNQMSAEKDEQLMSDAYLKDRTQGEAKKKN